jgi:hypothetical protein
MKTNILILITIATAILLTSCEKEIEFKGEQTDPKLVINSLVEPGQPVKASISKSYFFLDTPDTSAPDDVVATLYVNGNYIGEMAKQFDTVYWDGYEYDDMGNEIPSYYLATSFVNDYYPAMGDLVKITASAPGFDDVEATTSPLPNAVEAQLDMEVVGWSSWYQESYGETGEDSLLYITAVVNLTITIIDPNPGQSDAFRIHIDRTKSDPDSRNHIYCSAEYDDPIFGSTLPNNDFIDMSDLETRPEGVFSDVLFDGRSYQVKFTEVYVQMMVEETFDPDFFRLPVRVEHLSKEYYNYLYTCDQGDVALQIWAEPIQTYSNVTNGYGLLAGRNVHTLLLDLPLEQPR